MATPARIAICLTSGLLLWAAPAAAAEAPLPAAGQHAAPALVSTSPAGMSVPVSSQAPAASARRGDVSVPAGLPFSKLDLGFIGLTALLLLSGGLLLRFGLRPAPASDPGLVPAGHSRAPGPVVAQR